MYKSPEYEILSYGLAVDKLVAMGYPEGLKELKYDTAFSLRGLMLDHELGNVLKVDRYGSIIVALHGRTRMSKQEVLDTYPGARVRTHDIGSKKRFYLIDTLYGLPEACLLADLVEFLKTHGPEHGLDISFPNLHTDIRTAIDFIHRSGELKSRTVEDMPRYVRRDPRVPELLERMRSFGKVFLLTNSPYEYTESVMSYLFDGQRPGYSRWTDYFDIAIVSAGKPRFFGEGTPLREINTKTGNLSFCKVAKFEQGKIYSGGNLERFEELTGADGPTVLYVGDHIFGDVLASKKSRGWRSMLVVRELERELEVWQKEWKVLRHIRNLEFMRAETYRGMDCRATEAPDVSALLKDIEESSNVMDKAFNPTFGSAFRSGTKQTFLADQVLRFADLYAVDVSNLFNYPLFYHFAGRASSSMPHEEPEALDSVEHPASEPSTPTGSMAAIELN